MDVVAPDVRDVAAAEPARLVDDAVRVPTAKESADAVRRAQRAPAEIAQREVEDARRDTEAARADQLTRWHNDDHSTDHSRDTTVTRVADDVPVLARE